ncbi:hypothetical protein PCASD_04043 [Puccinia coronata f. sp. avenae]|uniref:orotate phosphoribosyltransferase n=1 Tax=Puccinia coronata f. sp. avenae TaxID=200324 RepID=A0A2N5TM57_9BASI|nr:hypothetical protein PCASD_24415 [Puccinia coronata f. sp. avenae]PLW45277.1 hypothetical protein PCASD_04043 [Puccinia coronata f. sp. avenae]
MEDSTKLEGKREDSKLIATTQDNYATRLIKASISHGILTFGSFELKSGRRSPYFYNSGLFNTGFLLNLLGLSYASKILELKQELEFDVIFGPAYKGIPIASITAAELNRLDPVKYHSVGLCFDRKEAKTHGEGGSIIGCPLAGKRVLIVDDVVTAGTAIRQSINTIQQHNGIFVGVLVNLDRQEKSPDSQLSAIQILESEFNVKVHSIIKLNQIIDLLKSIDGYQNEIPQLEQYRQQWGV